MCDITVWHVNQPSNRVDAPRRAVPLMAANRAEKVMKRGHVAVFAAALDAQGTPAGPAEVWW